jgi:hypothetical protein
LAVRAPFVLCQQTLSGKPTASTAAANLYNEEPLGEKAVNFRDFAKLANAWLEQKPYPQRLVTDARLNTQCLKRLGAYADKGGPFFTLHTGLEGSNKVTSQAIHAKSKPEAGAQIV